MVDIPIFFGGAAETFFGGAAETFFGGGGGNFLTPFFRV